MGGELETEDGVSVRLKEGQLAQNVLSVSHLSVEMRVIARLIALDDGVDGVDVKTRLSVVDRHRDHACINNA